MAVSIVGRQLKLDKIPKCYQFVRTGYIVLLPEVDSDQFDKNPLYKNGLPDVENFSHEKCVGSLGKTLLDLEQTVRDVENVIVERSGNVNLFKDVLDPLEEKSAQLESTWGLVKALSLTKNSIISSETYVSMHERARKARAVKYSSKIIYDEFKNCDTSKLTEEETRVLSKYVTEGKLNGLDLEGSKKKMYDEAFIGLTTEKFNYSKRVQASMKRFRHTIYDPKQVKDFPQDILEMLARKKENWKQGPWDIMLNKRLTNKFLSACPDPDLRWNLWMAHRQVASSHGGQPSELDNSRSLENIRSFRRDIAKLLGYETFADMSMETKMAGSLKNVRETLNLLLANFKPLQMKELSEVEEFALKNGFKGKLQLWDVPYWAKLHREAKYGLKENNIKEFFPLEKVLGGLMIASERCFGLKFVPSDKPRVWHPDIRMYNILDQHSNSPVAVLYLDPYSREGKPNSGEQMIGMKPACRALGSSPAVASLIFNFNPPSGKVPTLLDLDSVETVVKKFGRALQQLLSIVVYSEVSGLSNVEWDAVGVVSDFMSHWLEEPDVLQDICGHYSTDEIIPSEKLIAIRSHLIGHRTCQELYLANLDLELHTSKEFWVSITKNLWSQHFPFELSPDDSHVLSFTESALTFSAAYFSKLWAQMLAADAYATYKNEEDRKAIGLRFKDTFLSFGGACHPSEVFRRFQGRDPTPEAFIERYIT